MVIVSEHDNFIFDRFLSYQYIGRIAIDATFSLVVFVPQNIVYIKKIKKYQKEQVKKIISTGVIYESRY